MVQSSAVKYLIFLLFIQLFFILPANAQGWSTPVNVSNMGTHCNNPRMVVDHNGSIHAVWSMWVTQEYRKIMYSKSENQGDSWSTPIAIADDSLQWFGLPDIACDLQNQLYVTFEGDDMDPAHTLIYMVVFNGTTWSNPAIVSESMYGSNNSLVIVDNSNRLYCFWHAWFNNEVKLIYKYFENNVWSQPIIPYTEEGEFFWIKKIVADSANNLHCSGTHHYENESRYKDRVIYCYFNRNSSTWSPIENISDTTNCSWQGNSLDIDKNAIPHFTWGQYIQIYPSLDNGTLYRYPDNTGWLPVDSVEVNHNSHNHQIVVDISNQINICANQWTNLPNQPSDSYLIHYRNLDNIWIGEEIDRITPGAFYEPELVSFGNETVGIIYYKGSAINDSVSDIFFSKYDIFTKINVSDLPAINLTITPNPFNTEAEISYIVNSKCRILVNIFDINGNSICIITDQNQSPGRYCRTWQGTGLNGKEVAAGVYLVRLQAGRYVYSRRVIKL